MISISKPLTPGTVKQYFREEYSAARHSYFIEGQEIRGQWHGNLVFTFGLAGMPVTEEAFTRVSDGQDPRTGEALIKWRAAAEQPAWVRDQDAWAERIKAKYVAAAETGTSLLISVEPELADPPRGDVKPLPAREYTERQRRLIEMHEIAARLFREQLASEAGRSAREYLASRAVSPELAAEFGLGLAPKGDALRRELEPFGRETMEASGLFYVTEGGYLKPRFQGRLMFPLKDEQGTVIAFAGRTLDNREPRYVNSPETELYRKSTVLYNVHQAGRLAAGSGPVVVVEGYLDAIASHAAGIPTVATAGTAFTEEHRKVLESIAPSAIVAMDSDRAGLRAGKRTVATMLEAAMMPRVLTLLDGKDASAFVQEHGAEAWRAEVRKSRNVVNGLSVLSALEAAAKNGGAVDVNARLDAAREVMGILEKVDPARRVEIDRQLSAFFGQPIEQQKQKTVEHRAGWDLTFNAPKTVSVTALVGGDQRIIDAHEAAVLDGLNALQEYAQARMPPGSPAETTGKWIAALFRHDTARPVDGYPAPHVHTHSVVFNMTEDDTGKFRSLQTWEMFRAQSLAKAAYQAGLEWRLRSLGYEIEYGENHAPEIRGYSPEYLASESLRHEEIKAKADEMGVTSAAGEEIVQHQFREDKLKLTPDELRALHQANAAAHGNQPEKVVMAALVNGHRVIPHDEVERRSHAGLHFARARLEERKAVFEEFEVVRDALYHARGRAGIGDVRRALAAQVKAQKFVEVDHVRPCAPGHRFTTQRAIKVERETIAGVLAGQGKVQPIGVSAETIAERFPKLNDDQRRMVEAVLNTTDRIYGIGGKAGVGKTTALRAVRELIDPNTYRTHGLGATSQAILGLKDAGIESETVQRFLMRGGRIDGADERPVIFFVDESSLVSARQLHAITQAIRPMDRLVVVGDERQHDSVEAGRIFQELADAGMGVARLDKIVRQRDETLKEIVTDLSKGQVVAAVRKLEETDRITQVPHRARRFEAIAADYAAQSDGTLVISPDNRSRQELNAAIRQALRASGQLGEDAAEVTILVNRSNVTGPDRGLARTYRPDDVVLYRRRSTILGIEAGTFARVVAVNGSENLVSVEFENGRAVTYDPGRFMGVSIYEQETRKLARGDRIQFTAPDRQRRLYTRDLATVQTVDPAGNIQARLDRTGRLVKFNVRDNRLFDWSYAMTSHSSQGATVNRVLAHIDVGDSRVRNLLNETLAYVATSRAVHDLRIYTDNSHELARVLSRVNRNTVALSPAEIRSYHKQSVQMRKEIEKENAYDTGYAVTI